MAKLNIQPVTKSRLKEEAAKLEEKHLKGITQVKLFQVGNPDVGIWDLQSMNSVAGYKPAFPSKRIANPLEPTDRTLVVRNPLERKHLSIFNFHLSIILLVSC